MKAPIKLMNRPNLGIIEAMRAVNKTINVLIIKLLSLGIFPEVLMFLKHVEVSTTSKAGIIANG